MKSTQKYLLPVFLIACSPTVFAAEYQIGAQFSPTLSYDDNVRMRASNERSSFLTRITPTLQLSRYDDNSSINLNAGYRIERYASLSELDREDPFVNLAGSYHSVRSSYGLTAAYSQNAQRNIAEEDTGDFASNTTVTTRSISPSYQYQLSERDFVYGNMSYSERTYSSSQDEFGSLNRFSDNETLSAAGGWYRNFSERLTGGVQLAYAQYESESAFIQSEYDSYNVNLTSSYKMTERWSVNGSVGYRSTDSTTRPFVGPITGPKRSETTTGSLFDISLGYTGELNNLSASVSRSLQPSGEGVVNETDRIGLSWTRQLTEHLSFGLSSSYQESSSVGSLRNTERKLYIFSPTLNWRLQEQLSLRFGYQYRKQEGDILGSVNNSETIDSNMVFMTVNYNWPGIRFSR